MNTKIYSGIAIEHGKRMADEKGISFNTLLTLKPISGTGSKGSN
jgi:hypothetical protein